MEQRRAEGRLAKASAAGWLGFLVACGLAGIYACNRPSQAPAGAQEKRQPPAGAQEKGQPAFASAGDMPGSTVATTLRDASGCVTTHAQHDLTAEQQSEFFHAPEGSENLPLFLLKRLKNGSRPFIEEPGRFGLLEDDKDYKGRRLPVGMSVDRPRDAAWAKVDFVGFNCAACHVGQVAAGGCQQRILGAPSRFDIKEFYAQFAKAIQPMLNVRGYLTMLRWFYEERGSDGAGEELKQKMAIAELAGRTGGSGGTLQTPFKEVFAKMGDPKFVDPQLRGPNDAQPKLPAGVLPSLHEIDALDSSPDMPDDLKALNQALLQKRLKTTLTDYWDLVQLVRARLAFIKTLSENDGLPQTAPGPGRVDAFMTALNIMFGSAAKAPTTSPVSFPHLWGIKDLQWFHWDDNTNGIMDRNVGQAMGLGGVFMKRDGAYHSTLKPRSIAMLEDLAEHFKAPPWPFTPLDQAKVTAGKAHYIAQCASCHDPKTDGSMPEQPKLSDLKTDPLRVTNFALQIEGKPAIEQLRDKLTNLKQGAYKDHQVSLAEQKKMERNREVKFVARDRYSARPLRGVWATAPYLHNDAVPSLALLLGLEGKPRPERFVLQGEYDVANVGLEFREAASGGFSFDTSKKGNANTGHDYGVATLSDPQKRELIEYLKSLN